MNFQPLIDNLPTILIGIGLVLWALSRVVEAKAKANPAIDKWDEWQPKLSWASHMYSQAIDWLCETKQISLKGADKMAELNRLVKAFEDKITNGNYLEAMTSVIGYWTAAKNKIALPGSPGLDYLAGKLEQRINKVVPPATVPLPGSQAAEPSEPKA